MTDSNNVLQDSLILIVDDTLENIQVLGSILKNEGCQVAVAQNGKDALIAVEQESPDLVLMDVMMPEMDGFQATKILKTNPKTKDIPVIFLSAKIDAEDIVMGFDMGASDYLTKPFNVKELIVRVQTQIELKKGREKIATQNRERKELLHILCHDLANGFGAVLGIAKLNNEEREFFEVRPNIIGAMQNSLNIVDLVRKLRALEDKKQMITLEKVNLSSAVQTSKKLLQTRLAKKGITLQVSIDPEINIIAEETSLINSVLNNLLTNGIKFSYPQGVIQVTAEVQGKLVLLKVTDHGIGIPAELQKELFDSLGRTHRPGTEGEEGTGYGMPLMHKFITIYGGEISVTSHPESDDPKAQGSCFTISFKLF